MAYTQAWDEAAPPGTADSKTLDTIIQLIQTALRERLEQVVPDFGDDLIDPKRVVVHTGDTASRPAVVDSYLGEVYLDTEASQVYFFDGTDWLLVTPSGSPTGPVLASASYNADAAAGTRATSQLALSKMVAITVIGTTDVSGLIDVDLSEFDEFDGYTVSDVKLITAQAIDSKPPLVNLEWWFMTQQPSPSATTLRFEVKFYDDNLRASSLIMFYLLIGV